VCIRPVTSPPPTSRHARSFGPATWRSSAASARPAGSRSRPKSPSGSRSGHRERSTSAHPKPSHRRSLPTSTPSAPPGSSTAPGTTKPDGDRHGFGGFGGPGGFGLGGFGRFGARDITITAINGSELSLKTDDGWTRTISVTSTTKITKGGATIPVSDLAVGDQIAFAQDRATDGTYTVTAIRVILPTTAGQVTAINGNTITVTQPGGTTATIHVDGSTKYQVNGAAGALTDIKVGSFIVAEGTQRTDGSLDAAAIHAGDRGIKGPGFPGGRHLPDGQAPDASPTPSSTTS